MKFKVEFVRVVVVERKPIPGSWSHPSGSLTVEAESYEEAIAKFEQIIQPNPGERIERGEVTSEP